MIFLKAGDPVGVEERLIELEIKVTSQDDLTQQLSDLVYHQQKQIDALRALCTALVKRLGETSNDGGADTYTHERPPHY
jgi:SlyX protein